MTRRFEMTDAEWERLRRFCRRLVVVVAGWADHRRVISGILCRPRTGVPWRDLRSGSAVEDLL